MDQGKAERVVDKAIREGRAAGSVAVAVCLVCSTVTRLGEVPAGLVTCPSCLADCTVYKLK
mgnify:FL=1